MIHNRLYRRLHRWWHRRHHTRHLSTDLLRRITLLLAVLAGLITLHAMVMMWAEGFPLGDALWLSATTVTTVGYGDLSPTTTIGRLATVICIYIFAITVLTQLVGEILDWRLLRDEKKRTGDWEWRHMKGHIQIINAPNTDAETYLTRLIGQMQLTPTLGGRAIQLLTRKYSEGLPPSLRALNVLHRTGYAESNEMLSSIHVQDADYIIVLARDASDTLSDCVTFDILSRIREMGTQALIAAEAVDDCNRQRFIAAGATVVLRPIRAYPELMVRALIHPGTEKIMEDLFTHEGARMVRYDMVFEPRPWSELVSQLINAGAGTAVGFVDDQGQCVTGPSSTEVVRGSGVICLVGEQGELGLDNVRRALQG